MRRFSVTFGVLTLVCLGGACRYSYELVPLDDRPSGGAANETPGPGGAHGAGRDATGGAAAGVPDTSPMAGDGGIVGEGGGASGSGSGGTSGDSAAGGSDGSGGLSADPPDMTLCTPATFAGHDYLFCKELRSWSDANGGCQVIGMQLARVDDVTENQWLVDNAKTPGGSDSLVWLGATDQAVEGTWRWTDGALFWLGDSGGLAQDGLFAGWYSREPNDVDQNEDCASLETKSSNGDWYDSRCELGQSYVCKSP